MPGTKKTARGQSSRAGGSTDPKAWTNGRKSRSAHALMNHDEIRRWVELRGGRPACVRGTGGRSDTGMLRIDFPDGEEASLQPIEWSEWFEKFDEKDLALMVQEGSSRFNKLVSRDSIQDNEPSGRSSTPKTRTAGG